MKRFLLLLSLAFTISRVSGQNVQLHDDFGHLFTDLSGRPSMTTTVEMFKPDQWGNTFSLLTWIIIMMEWLVDTGKSPVN